MSIFVEIGEWASNHTKTGVFPLVVPNGATVEDIILMLNIPPDEIGLSAVANKHVTRGHTLSEGDRIKFFPCIVGG